MDRIFTHNKEIVLNAKKSELIPPRIISILLYTIIISHLLSLSFSLLCMSKIYPKDYWISFIILGSFILASISGFLLKKTKMILYGVSISISYPASFIGICIFGYICKLITLYEFVVWLSASILILLTGSIIIGIAIDKIKTTPLNIEKTYLYFTNEGIHGDSFVNASRKNLRFSIQYNDIINTYETPVSISDNQYCNLCIESTQGTFTLPLKDPDIAIDFINKAVEDSKQHKEIDLPQYLPSGKYY